MSVNGFPVHSTILSVQNPFPRSPYPHNSDMGNCFGMASETNISVNQAVNPVVLPTVREHGRVSLESTFYHSLACHGDCTLLSSSSSSSSPLLSSLLSSSPCSSSSSNSSSSSRSSSSSSTGSLHNLGRPGPVAVSANIIIVSSGRRVHVWEEGNRS